MDVVEFVCIYLYLDIGMVCGGCLFGEWLELFCVVRVGWGRVEVVGVMGYLL